MTGKRCRTRSSWISPEAPAGSIQLDANRQAVGADYLSRVDVERGGQAHHPHARASFRRGADLRRLLQAGRSAAEQHGACSA